MDNVGHEATHHRTKIHREEDGKVIEKDMAREHRRVASPKEEKMEPMGKARQGERKDNVSTKSQNQEITEPPEEQWSSGSLVQWSDQSWSN